MTETNKDEKPLKLMVCGDVKGKIKMIYSRITKLQQKGQKFDMLFCVGDFFGGNEKDKDEWLSYRNGTKTAPIPTYILGPNNIPDCKEYTDVSLDDGFEFCENITYLGRKGIFTESSGLKIVYLSGIESPAGASPAPKHCFTRDDVSRLSHQLDVDSDKYKGVDILLTSVWPRGVSNYAHPPTGVKHQETESLLLSEFVASCRPRYHFAALGNLYYERSPYRNHIVLTEQATHVSRYIALAEVGNKQKQKYLYAFIMSPLSLMDDTELRKQPDNTTECPFKRKEKMKTYPIEVINGGGTGNFRWNMDQPQGRKRHGDNNRDDKNKKQRIQDWKCWFCLGGEKVETHLVVSVGELVYLAMAKGGLNPHHILICPVAHHMSYVDCPDDTKKEIEKYKECLKKAFDEDGKNVVFFERNYRSNHLQIQVVPVPEEISSDTIKNSFFGLARSHTDKFGKPNPLDLAEIPKRAEIKQMIPAGIPYFHAELPDGCRLLMRIQGFFPLQFGREVCCLKRMLNLPDRIHWKSCVLPKPEETEWAEGFKTFFKKYDFSLEEDDDDDSSDDDGD